MTILSTNRLSRYLFDAPIRFLHISLDDVWQHIVEQKNYPPVIERALGEVTAAAVLLAANLKFSGSLLLQIQGQGSLKLLVAEATSNHTCRASARWDATQPLTADQTLAELLGENARLVMTLQSNHQEEPWQAIVAVNGQTMAEMLMHYMHHSEQLDSQIVLAANHNKAAGLFVQRLPHDGSDDHEDLWQEKMLLAQTVGNDELLHTDAATLVHRLYHQAPPQLLGEQTWEFACNCSEEKVKNMLQLLGRQEVEDVVAEQGSIEVQCDFCQSRYVFDENDIQAIFATK